MIDDDPEDAMFLKDGIASLFDDVAVEHVSDGAKALGHLLQVPIDHYPDVIFMDISMPLSDGWECLREIKRLSALSKIPIVMFSTLNFETSDLNPSDVGAAAFMTKPASMTNLKVGLTDLFKRLFPGYM